MDAVKNPNFLSFILKTSKLNVALTPPTRIIVRMSSIFLSENFPQKLLTKIHNQQKSYNKY